MYGTTAITEGLLTTKVIKSHEKPKGELTACVKSLQLHTRGCVIEVCLGLRQTSNFSCDEPNPNFGRPKLSSPVVSDVCRS